MLELVVLVRNMIPYGVRHCIMSRCTVLIPYIFHTWQKSTGRADSDQMRMSRVKETVTAIIVIGETGHFRVSHLKVGE